MDKGQRKSLSPSLSTASDSNEERRSPLSGFASALRREDSRQTEGEGKRRKKKSDRSTDTLINEDQSS